jgi:hypothetical protein
MQIPCVYIPGPAPAVTVANNYKDGLNLGKKLFDFNFIYSF